MKGILTDCNNGTEKEVELEYEIKEREGRRIFWLLNGVTGWESFYIDKVNLLAELSRFETNLKEMAETGWLACAGTPRKYDRLFISGIEMKKVFEKEGLI